MLLFNPISLRATALREARDIKGVPGFPPPGTAAGNDRGVFADAWWWPPLRRVTTDREVIREPFVAYLDTGAHQSYMRESLAERIFENRSKWGVNAHYPVWSDLDGCHVTGGAISLGHPDGVRLDARMVRVIADVVWDGRRWGPEQMLVGMDLLSRGMLLVAGEHCRMADWHAGTDGAPARRGAFWFFAEEEAHTTPAPITPIAR